MPRYSTTSAMFDTSDWPTSTARPEAGELRSVVAVPALHRSPVEGEAPAPKSAVRAFEERAIAHERAQHEEHAQVDVDATQHVDRDALRVALPSGETRAKGPAELRAETFRARTATSRRTVRRTRPLLQKTLGSFGTLTRSQLQQLVDDVAADAFRTLYGEG